MVLDGGAIRTGFINYLLSDNMTLTPHCVHLLAQGHMQGTHKENEIHH